MPWVIFQDYAHHIEDQPVRVLAPWHLFAPDAKIDARLPKVWLPEPKVPLLEQQVANEYQGDPPPVNPQPIPEPQPEPEDELEN
jgi:hypothetical protein